MSIVRSASSAHRAAGWLLAASAVVAVSACAPQASSTTTASDASASGTAQCTKDALALKTDGTLTIGTDSPAYSPWFEDNDPANGEGYESAVAYAVADQLGFAADEVTWTTVSFNASFAPGTKTFDFFVNQVSITDERKTAVDFSSGYYSVRQAVVTVKGSSIASAASIADLKAAKLGAQVGTTSYAAITDQIAPTQDAAVFNTNDDAVKALQNGQIDGLVVDLPTALYLSAATITDGVLVGQLPQTSADAEQFGLVLEKDSGLTACVTQAVDALEADGTLAELQKTWLTESAGAKELS